MIQTFEAPGGPQIGRENLPRLRKTLAKMNLEGFIVPHEDEYQNEYVPAAFDRLMWTTGFTGSAGAAVVLKDKAAIFVDGRYTLQARVQVDGKLFAHEDLTTLGPAGWIAREAQPGIRIGYDPKLFSPEQLERLKAAAEQAKATLTAVQPNPIDLSWERRPPAPAARVAIQAEEFSGESASAKRHRLGKTIAAEQADVAVISSPASLAWLFNIRGGDVARSPLPLGAALLHSNGRADLFLAPEKVTDELRSWLGNEVSLRAEDEIEAAIDDLKGKRVRIDPASSSAWWFDKAADAGAKIVRAMDPVMIPRACKNEVELAGVRRAHVRDGAALSRFLHWLATDGQSGKIDEIEACRVLENFRAETGLLKDLSFDSISGAGPNGALPHYRVNEKTNRKLKRGSLYLIDSGGQYLDGTTDVTRTVAIGRPTPEMKDRFTRVLKGHIALAQLRFPAGTTGSAIDAVARMALWQAGCDYDHGTGHGVGAYLGVHEGPQRISKAPNTIALRPGMIVSNEPGYYKEGEYGIRIENLQAVTAPTAIPGGDKEMLGFETLTFAPIDRTLIDKKLLDSREKAWLDDYHRRVIALIAPQLSGETLDWLTAAAAPL